MIAGLGSGRIVPAVATIRGPGILALGAALVLLLVEAGRIPADNSDTHLELTMIHEGMLLEHSGPVLAPSSNGQGKLGPE